MRRIAFASALACLFAAIVAPTPMAQDRQAIARCAAMKGDLDRLSCFDDLARKSGLSGP
jgi:hypothetical protein